MGGGESHISIAKDADRPNPQTGMVASCMRFYDVQGSDNCVKLASEAGIPVT